jgi:hypothetical protein
MDGTWIIWFASVLIAGMVGYSMAAETKKEKQARGWTVLETLSNGHNRTACRLLGEALEIRNDGDDVGEFVEWAVNEAYVAEKKLDLAYRAQILDRRLKP